MIETLDYSTPVARKEYSCMASEWIVNCCLHYGSNGIFNFSELRSIIKAKQNDWMIKKGEKYSYARCKADGDLYTWRAIPEIEAICHKYNLMEV